MMHSGLDYRWEIAPCHKHRGHIIHPFTSLSITRLDPLPHSAPSLQLRDTSRPVCYEVRVEQSRRRHDNKLADGCRENKGHQLLDISRYLPKSVGHGAWSKKLLALWPQGCCEIWGVQKYLITVTCIRLKQQKTHWNTFKRCPWFQLRKKTTGNVDFPAGRVRLVEFRVVPALTTM